MMYNAYIHIYNYLKRICPFFFFFMLVGVSVSDLHTGELNWDFPYTSVVIYHSGASLSEQHTDLLICHRTKQDLLCTSRYLGIT